MKVKKKLKAPKADIKSSQRRLKEAIAAATSASTELRRQLAALEKVQLDQVSKLADGGSIRKTKGARKAVVKPASKPTQPTAPAALTHTGVA